MFTKRLFALAAFAAALAISGASNAQPSMDPAAAPAGAYTVDGRHAAVIARVPHGGFSFSIFRFNTVSGNLTWDPADASKNHLNATIETASIDTNVPGFAEELAGAGFLNAAQFPQATFVSTAFHQTDATHGTVDGVLTIKGVAKNVTFDANMIGAGQGMRGIVLGVHATTTVNAGDYSLPPFIQGPIEIVIDVEFDKAAS